MNGTLVLLFRMAIAGWTERFDSGKVLTAGFLLLAVVSAGYGWAGSFAWGVGGAWAPPSDQPFRSPGTAM